MMPSESLMRQYYLDFSEPVEVVEEDLIIEEDED